MNKIFLSFLLFTGLFQFFFLTTQLHAVDALDDVSKSLVEIRGDNGAGTGFTSVWKDKMVIITNAHVVTDNPNIKFKDINNNKIPVKGGYFVKGRDLAIFVIDKNKLAEEIPALKIHEKVIELDHGRGVAAMGNSRGQGVFEKQSGEVRTVGPTKIEISSKIEPGNSGGPILLTDLGEVVGVTTYATFRKKDLFEMDGGQVTKKDSGIVIRRFGTRIDNVQLRDLQKLTGKEYYQDLKVMNRVKNAENFIIFMFNYFVQNQQNQRGPEISNKEIKTMTGYSRVLKSWNRNLVHDGPFTTYRKNQVQRSIRHMKKLIKLAIKKHKRHKYTYTYIQDTAETHVQRLEAANQNFSKVIGKLLQMLSNVNTGYR